MKQIPFILLACSCEHEMQQRGFAAEADDFLTKPIWAGSLVAAVNRHLFPILPDLSVQGLPLQGLPLPGGWCVDQP